ncbi:MAG: hypothetical protein QXH57_03480, partial [Sulfolobales archaeon]
STLLLHNTARAHHSCGTSPKDISAYLLPCGLGYLPGPPTPFYITTTDLGDLKTIRKDPTSE